MGLIEIVLIWVLCGFLCTAVMWVLAIADIGLQTLLEYLSLGKIALIFISTFSLGLLIGPLGIPTCFKVLTRRGINNGH